ncbi:MAG: ABC transporter substrate-binding protein [Burkholderiales bacterium]
MIKKLVSLAIVAAGLSGAAVAQETIKIGVMPVDSGPISVYSVMVTNPAELAIDALNAKGGALGRKYELVTQAHNGTPAGALAAASKLVQQSGVSYLVGVSTSSIASALAPRLSGLNALFLDTGSGLDDLVGKGCQPNFFRISSNDSMMINTLRAAVKQSGAKTWNLLMADYALGHEFAKTFEALVQENGGTVQTTLFAPLTTTDFGSFISQLSAKPADGLGVFYPGSGGVAFAKQQHQFGLFPKFKSVLTWYFTNDLFLPAMGDTVTGAYSAMSYSWDQPGAANAAFVKAFEAKYKRKPVYGDADNYAVYEILNAAILKAKSADMAAVRAALPGLKVNTVLGDVEMRAADHQLVRSMTLAQVVKTGDKVAMVTRAVEPGAKVTPPPNPECKL